MTFNPYKIPRPWLDFLLSLQDEAPEACIAGGCLRDWDNDRPVKDVDVFADADELGDKLRSVFGEDLVNTGLPEYVAWRELDGDLGGLFTVRFEDMSFEVIGVKHGRNMTARSAALRNDFGICQIAHDGVWGLFRSDQYLKDQENKTFTLTHALNNAAFHRSIRRYHRLQSKYPDFRLVVPDHIREHLSDDTDSTR